MFLFEEDTAGFYFCIPDIYSLSTLCVYVLVLINYITTSVIKAQTVKNLPMRETWVRSLGGEDPQEKRMATHSSILAWRIPWTEEPGGLQSKDALSVP